MTQAITCPVCGHNRSTIKTIVKKYTIWECNECGLYWTPGIDDQELAGFYEERYFQGSQEYGYANYVESEGVQRRNARRLIQSIADHTPREDGLSRTKLLDVGCAHGFLVDEACRAGFQAEGVDCSVEGVRYATETLGRKVFLGTVNDAAYPDNHFDVVTSIGSIEHLNDPVRFVKEAARITRRGALFVITTLDTKFLMGLFRFKPPEHIYYFSRHNLPILLGAHGFAVEQLEAYRASHALGEVLGLVTKLVFGSRVNLEPLIQRSPLKNLCLDLPNNEMLLIARKI